MNLSVIIPCYNERSTIESVLKAVRFHAALAEIIVVDDFSIDGTREWLELNQDIYNFRLFMQEKNSGKGAALQMGFSKATQDIVIIQDADLEYDPADYQKLVQPILDNIADVVYGSRFKYKQDKKNFYFLNYWANKFLTYLSNFFNKLNLTDMETCYKVFRREVVQSLNLREKRFGIEPEITAKIAKKKLRIFEVAISYQGRRFNEGKKIGFKDGVWAIFCIVCYAFFD
jgi:glycosyltransferase involved in cell wall biosynthesis